MKKTTHKLMYVLGTIFLLVGTIMSTVSSMASASTVESSSESHVLKSMQSSVSSSSKSSVALNSSSVANSQTNSASSQTNLKSQNLAATPQSTNSGATPTGQTQINQISQGNVNSQGVYPHFQTADGEVVYCYNWDWPAPDAIGTEYNEYKFYNGMKEITGDQVKVDEVAAAMLAGYHKDADTGKYNVVPQFQSLVDDSYQDFLQGRNDPSSPFYGIKIPTPYTKEEFEQDVTQSVIWKIDGASSASGEQQGLMASYTKLGQAILSYTENHPLDQQTAFPKNVTVTTKTDGGTVSESHIGNGSIYQIKSIIRNKQL